MKKTRLLFNTGLIYLTKEAKNLVKEGTNYYTATENARNQNYPPSKDPDRSNLSPLAYSKDNL